MQPDALKNLLRECEEILEENCSPDLQFHVKNVLPLLEEDLKHQPKSARQYYLNGVFLTMKSEYSASRLGWMATNKDALQKRYNAIGTAFLILDKLQYLVD